MNSSRPQTQTTIAQPPSYLMPYVQEALRTSRDLYYRTPGGAPTMAGVPSVTQPGMPSVPSVGQPRRGMLPSQPAAPYGNEGGTFAHADPRTLANLRGPDGNLVPGFSGGAPQFMPQGTSSGFPEAPVIPFAPQTQTALDWAQNRAMAGSPVNNAAQDYAQRTLSGGFMGSNPWLDRTFNRAAGAVTNQVQSNFGVSGRNPRGVDAAGFAADMYGNLATDIYGGDYQAERQRQQQLVPFAGQMAQQDYADIERLGGVGAAYEDLARERANASDLALDAYLARISGFPGSSVTQTMPQQRNRLAGALGGGLAGLGALGSLGLMGTPLGWGILGGSALLGAM